MIMIKQHNEKIVFANDTGLRAQAAALLAKLTILFDAMILVRCNGKTANASRFLDVLSVCAAKGKQISVSITGCDAKDALQAVRDVFSYNYETAEDCRQQRGSLSIISIY